MNAVHPSLSRLKQAPFWQEITPRVECAPLTHDATVDLLVVGGGFTGLWTAIEAKLASPDASVMLVDARVVGGQASGRNGGFIHATLTHGFANGMSRWPDEYPRLHKLGTENLAYIRNFVRERKLECNWLDAGELEIARQDHEFAGLEELHASLRELDPELELLSGEQMKQRINSEAFVGALFDPRGVATLNPTALAQGLLREALREGVAVHEHSELISLRSRHGAMECQVRTAAGTHVIGAKHVALATNAFRSPIAAVRRRIAPVYDYAIVTEPLSQAQWESVGWSGHEGGVETSNLFHYFRRTPDGRILWGGYDAEYHWRNATGEQFEANQDCFNRLAVSFFETFPQLDGITFDFGWGGAIDTCSRFSPFWGTAFQGKVAYVAGFTGLGVGSSRFGALTMLDLLSGNETERTKLKMVREKPMPYPPEPFRSAAIAVTKWSLARADHKRGRRNLWLRLLDSLGVGFDS